MQPSRNPSAWRCFGALPETGGVRFRTFRGDRSDLTLELHTGAAAGLHRLAPSGPDLLQCFVAGAGAGDLYTYRVGDGSRPDPASRHQPEGVHGRSQVVDPDAYRWRHHSWPFVPDDLVIYELHVGTFTEAGTFAAARARLPELQALGVNAIELMPVAEFPGRRNWGYDGVGLFAPSHTYGRPDDLRALVDAAHGLGIGVLLDVVYNHLGPEGAYLPQFQPAYITHRHHTPWGGAINLDGREAASVRSFIIDNAVHWVTEYRLDGLRLDATHSLVDDSVTHLVSDLAATVRAAVNRPLAIIAEDHRNLTSLVEARHGGGWELDGIWADDFHHVLRRRLAGDCDGYYRDYTGAIEELVATLRQGWLYTGQYSQHGGCPRGTDPSSTPMHRFVICLQNHDQIGNRPAGDRLNHAIDAAVWRAASALLLTAPMTPLLFMGQEWAASSPFQYFTDLEPELGVRVTEGRRHEFRHFPGFSDPAARAAIPDPQDTTTFERSRLNWPERARPLHAANLALYTELLRLRRAHRALGASRATSADAEVLEASTLALRREAEGRRIAIVVRLEGSGMVSLPLLAGRPTVLLTTEEPRFALDPQPARIDADGTRVEILFRRPGAVLLEY